MGDSVTDTGSACSIRSAIRAADTEPLTPFSFLPFFLGSALALGEGEASAAGASAPFSFSFLAVAFLTRLARISRSSGLCEYSH